ncbi:hypothetical protein ABVN80_19065 [Acinetobacter baumannii]
MKQLKWKAYVYEVSAAEGEKCARCCILPDVNTHTDHPEFM